MVFMDFLKPFILGAISILSAIVFIWVIFYWVPKTLGLYRLFYKIFAKKIPDKVYEDVADDVISKEKFNKIAERYLKYPKKKRKLYFRAYEELKELQKKEEDI